MHIFLAINTIEYWIVFILNKIESIDICMRLKFIEKPFEKKDLTNREYSRE